MRKVILHELRDQYAGTKFHQLIEHHLKSKRKHSFHEAFLGTFAMLPNDVQYLVEDFIDRWNSEVYNKDFWRQDTALVFDKILDDAVLMLTAFDCETCINDETLFNLFQIIVLSYAHSAETQPNMRNFIGIKEKPWWKKLF